MEEKKFTWKEIDEEVEGIVTETVKFLSDLKGRVDAVQEKIKQAEEPFSIEEKLIAALDKETIKEMSQMCNASAANTDTWDDAKNAFKDAVLKKMGL